MSSWLWVVCLVGLVGPMAVLPKKLESVGDKELLRLLSVEKYVVVLFQSGTGGGGGGGTKADLEHELAMARETLVDDLGAWVVKTVDSPMARQYTPKDQSPPNAMIVFFRSGVPMLYHGPPTEEDILIKLTRAVNSEPLVVQLTDDNFEHLTQAATGATTGDWLVMFYKEHCPNSQKYHAMWDAVGLELKGRINVARVNRQGNGGVTARRFDLERCPAIILLRHGKFYNYELDEITIQSSIDFAVDFYRNSKGIPVPAPKSPFDDLTEMIAEKLKDNPELVQIIAAGVGGLLILLLIFFIFRSRANSKNNKSPQIDLTKKKKVIIVKKKKDGTILGREETYVDRDDPSLPSNKTE